MPHGPDLEPIEQTGGGEASKGVLRACHGTFRLTDCSTPSFLGIASLLWAGDLAASFLSLGLFHPLSHYSCLP